ncbi:MAG: hypothetical protein AAGK05_18150, partial [Pseudomonadota bacterium]
MEIKINQAQDNFKRQIARQAGRPALPRASSWEADEGQKKRKSPQKRKKRRGDKSMALINSESDRKAAAMRLTSCSLTSHILQPHKSHP